MCNTDLHQHSLDRLVAAGTEFACLALDQAKIVPAAIPVLATAFDKLSRSVRRSIALAHKLEQPARHRTNARREIIRAVEDRIQRRAEGEEADALHEELYERMDSPDLDDSLFDRPLDAFIIDLARDLGLEHMPGHNHPWARRTPADIATLEARAARPPRPGAAPPPSPSYEPSADRPPDD